MDWLAVLSPENFERTRALGFAVQGFKTRHRARAFRMRPGDGLAYYLIREGRFAASVVVRSACFEDRRPIWMSPRNPDEPYPWRVMIEAEFIVPPGLGPRASELVTALEFVKRWPSAHWRLAFQGMLREIPAADGALIRGALKRELLNLKGQEGHPG
jgi:hypothetical protein